MSSLIGLIMADFILFFVPTVLNNHSYICCNVWGSLPFDDITLQVLHSFPQVLIDLNLGMVCNPDAYWSFIFLKCKKCFSNFTNTNIFNL